MKLKYSQPNYERDVFTLEVGDRIVKESRYHVDEIVTITRVTKTQAMYETSTGNEHKLRREAISYKKKEPAIYAVGRGGVWSSLRYRVLRDGDEERIKQEHREKAVKYWYKHQFEPTTEQLFAMYETYGPKKTPNNE